MAIVFLLGLSGSEDIREHVRAAFTELKGNLDSMIINKPERRIILRKKAAGE